MADTPSTRSALLRLALVACACLFASSAARAQTESTAGVRGIVTAEASGLPVSGARVLLRNEALRVERETTADEGGNYAISGLPPGDGYKLTTSADGFRPLAREQITLVSGGVLDVSLELRLLGLSETVEVLDSEGAIVSNAPEVSQAVTPRQLAELPSNGRSLNRFALLDPHVRNTGGLGSDGSGAQRLSINASSYRLTQYKLDGNSNYDFVFANAPQQQVSLSAVQEFKVLTNQYSAEYGGTSAGIVSAVTRSGTADFHGEGFYFLRPSGLQAAPPVSTAHVPNELQQFGGALGGPLVTKRAAFFFNYERARQNRGSFVQSPAPLVYTGHSRDHTGLARFDYQLTNTHALALRLNANRNTNDNANDRVGGLTQPSAATLSRTQGAGGQLTDRTVRGSSVNELRLSYVNSLPSAGAARTPSVSVVRPSYSTEGGSSYSWVRTQTWQVADQFAAERGRHELKFGGDFARQKVADFGETAFGEYRFATGAPRPNETYLDFTQKFGTGFVRYGQTLASAFVQDNWRIGSRLTANLGLRYDYQSSTDDRNNFAPRLGFAWDVAGDGKTILRGGAGLFYDQYYMYITRRFLLEGPDAKIRTYRFTPTQAGAPSFPNSPAEPPAGSSEAIRDYVYLPADRLLNPYNMQFSFGVQRELFADWTLTADVIHSRTLKQQRVNDLNAPAPFIRTAPGQTRAASRPAACRNSFNGACLAFGGYADETRPFGTNYMGVPVRKVAVVENTASSSYDALELGLVKRFSRRFQFESHYVLASALTDAMFFGEADTGIPNQFGVSDPGERAPSDFLQRHRLVAHGLFETPFGTQFSAIATIASGLPVNPLTGLDDNGDGYKSDRPVGLARNSFRTPAQAAFDASLAKRFTLREGVRLELRGEVFNLLNHSNFIKLNNVYGNATTPDPKFLAPLAGVQNSDPGRQFQFGARLSF
jgi:outer membrane receptor protein involved in Fe transport